MDRGWDNVLVNLLKGLMKRQGEEETVLGRCKEHKAVDLIAVEETQDYAEGVESEHPVHNHVTLERY